MTLSTARGEGVGPAVFSVGRAVLAMGVTTVAVKAVALARDFVVARQFGTGGALDAFLVAFVTVLFGIGVLASSLPGAVVPVFVEVQERAGRAEARRLLGGVTLAVLVTHTVLGVALAAAFDLALPRFARASLSVETARPLMAILVPGLVLNGLSSTWGAVLNSTGRFAFPAVLPVATPCCMLAFLLLARHWGVYALAYGFVLGALVEAALLAWSLDRAGLAPWPRWEGWTLPLTRVFRQYRASASGAALLSSTSLIENSIAASLGTGGVSVFNYGSKVVAFSVGIGSVVLTTVALPHLSQLIAQRRYPTVRRALRGYMLVTLAATIPLAAVLAIFSEPLTRLLFERGAFTPHDTLVVSRFQALYVLYVPVFAAGVLLSRVIVALQASHILTFVCAVNLMVNVILNLSLTPRLGLAGLAVTTISMYSVSLVIMGWQTRRILRERERLDGTS